MTERLPFYKSLRFRFGLIFGSLILCFLLAIAIFLYLHVKKQFETGYDNLLNGQAKNLLEKVELNPLTLPVPQPREFYVLFFDNGKKTDTLYRRLPEGNYFGTGEFKRFVSRTRSLETGAVLRIQYGLASTELDTRINELRSILFVYLPVALIIALLAGYVLSGYLLLPITRIVSRANETALKTEIQLLPLPKVQDELYQLTVSLNRMLARIKEQSDQEAAFFASAAHELRTPLSLMLTELQVLNNNLLSEPMADLVHNQIGEVKRLGSLVDMFLLMSQLKGQSGGTNTLLSVVSVQDELIDMVSSFGTRGEQKNIQFRIELVPMDAEFQVLANPGHLRIMIGNLLENAIKFGVPGNPVSIVVKQDLTAVRIGVSNEAAESVSNIDQLKERFVKGDSRRDGFGLGLWIVESLAAANNAALTLSFIAPVFTAVIEFADINSPGGGLSEIPVEVKMQ